MNLLFGRFRVGLALVLLGVPFLCLWASVWTQQNVDSGTDPQTGIQMPRSLPDFEVKVVDGEFLVRRTGSQEWKRSSKLNEPVAVGFLDGTHKIYTVSRVIKPPKAKHQLDPDYPPEKRSSGKQGATILHMVVDDHGAVRFPTVDASADPEFTKTAIDAVKKWTFEPAKLNGQPVAVLVIVRMEFRTY